MVSIPVLETPRLRLRGHALSDLDSAAAMWAEESVNRYISGKIQTREEVWGKLLRYRGHWSFMGFGYWVVEEKASGAIIGELGFSDFKRIMEPSIEGHFEAGWAFATQGRGKGYATEALTAALIWGQEKFGADKIVCIVDPANTASCRLAERCGFIEQLRTTYHDEPTVLYKLAR